MGVSFVMVLSLSIWSRSKARVDTPYRVVLLCVSIVSENIKDTLQGPPTVGQWVMVRRQWPGPAYLESASDLYHAIAVERDAPLPNVDIEMCLRLAAISSISGPDGWDTPTTDQERREAIAAFVAKYGPLGIGIRQIRDEGDGAFFGESESRWWRESLAVWQVMSRARFLKLIKVSSGRVKKGIWWYMFVGDHSSTLTHADEPEKQTARAAVLNDLRREITERLRSHTKIVLVGAALPLTMQIEATTPLGCIWRFLAEFVTGAPVMLRPCVGGCGRLLVASPQRGPGRQRSDVKQCTDLACRKRLQRARFVREGLTARGTERKRAPNKSKRGGNRGEA